MRVASVRFTATIQQRGINPYVEVTAARATKLKAGWRKPLPVLVRIEGAPAEACRTNLMPTGSGGFYLYLHAAVRAASSTAVGDRVRVELRFDPGYRGGPAHPVPPAFRAALRANPIAQQHWQALPPSRRKEVLRYLASLKSTQARARNVERALDVLAGHAARFMARSWKDGR